MAEATSEVEAWREVHSTLLKACELAQEAVLAQKMQYRFWLEEICANLTEDGHLSSHSVWIHPAAVPRSKATSSKKKAGAPKRKRKGKEEATDAHESSSGRGRKRATSVAAAAPTDDYRGDDGTAEPRPEHKPKKIKISLKKSGSSSARDRSEGSSSERVLLPYPQHEATARQVLHSSPATSVDEYGHHASSPGEGATPAAMADYLAAVVSQQQHQAGPSHHAVQYGTQADNRLQMMAAVAFGAAAGGPPFVHGMMGSGASSASPTGSATTSSAPYGGYLGHAAPSASGLPSSYGNSGSGVLGGMHTTTYGSIHDIQDDDDDSEEEDNPF